MSGTLYHLSTDAIEPGTPVLILVNDVNSPTGTWMGELVSINSESKPASDKRYYIDGTLWVSCTAKITDPKHTGKTPHVNYTVYPLTTSTKHFLRQVESLKVEVRGLNNRLRIERQVFHGLMASIVSGEALADLKTTLDNFLTRLTEARR